MKTVIGTYKITRRLPGDGESYTARSSRGVRCTVRVFEGAADGSGWGRAQREAGIAALLEHEAVHSATDCFDDDGKLVLVFPQHEEVTLAALLTALERAGDSLDAAAVWVVAHAVIAALAQGHSASDEEGDLVPVCHGHLSPASVLIDSSGAVKLDGLGLASLVGTPGVRTSAGYEPPEQRGNASVTPRGDVFAFGVLVWRLLADREPPPGVAPTMRMLDKALPSAVDEALGRALEPSVAERRITSMELEGWLADTVEPEAGTKALVAAVARVRSVATPLGAPRPPVSPLASKTTPAGSNRAALPRPARTLPRPHPPPPLRSKQATLVGNPTDSKDGASAGGSGQAGAGGAPATSDLKNLEQTVAIGDHFPIDDELSWSTDGAPTSGHLLVGGTTVEIDDGDVDESIEQAFDSVRLDLPRHEADEDVTATVALENRSSDEDDDFGGLRDSVPDSESDIAATVAVEHGLATPVHASLGPVDLGPSGDGAAAPDSESDIAATVAVEDALAGPDSAGSDSAGPDSAGPDSAGPGSAGPGSAGPDSAGPDSAGPGSAGPGSAGPGSAGPDSAGPDSAGPDSAGPDSAGPGSVGSDSAGSDSAGPDSAGPDSAAPVPAPPASAPPSSSASPWREHDRESAAGSEPLSIGKAIGIAVLTAVIVMAVGIWWSRQQLDVPVPTAAPSAAPSASTTTRGPTTRASQTPVTTRSSAAPIASTSAVPSAEPSAAEPPADPASSDEGGDGSELPPTLGYLQVKFNGEQGGEVFVFAKSYGPVGQKLKVPCNRPAFVRIGKTPGPRWITKGKTVSIACQKVTVTFISP